MESTHYNSNICTNCGIDYRNSAGEIVSIKRFIFPSDWVITRLRELGTETSPKEKITIKISIVGKIAL